MQFFHMVPYYSASDEEECNHDITMPIGSHINIWSLKQSRAHTNWSPAVGHADVTDKVRKQLPPQAEGAQSSLADQITSLEGVFREEFRTVHEKFIDLYVRFNLH